jgi:hypothetical protein
MADRGQRSVDSDCHLRRADGRPLPNVFSLGLASGYLPHGAMGGEASFVGQQNSSWLYQNDIGRTVYRSVQNCLSRPRATFGGTASRPPALKEEKRDTAPAER